MTGDGGSIRMRGCSEAVLGGTHGGRAGLARFAELARHHVGFDTAYVAELVGRSFVCRAVAGDSAGFGLDLDAPLAAEAEYCRLLVRGDAPCVVADATATPRSHARAPGVGASVGVTLALPDGSPFGVLCCLNRTRRPRLGRRGLQLLDMLADLMASELIEHQHREHQRAAMSQLIERERVAVVYQPLFDLSSGSCLGVEALADFDDALGSPNQAFAAAAAVGLGLELERLVVRQAWSMLGALRPGQFLALNVTPDALIELARRASLRDDLALDSIVIEVTEHAIVESYTPLCDELAPLRRRGLRIAVDDAGAGYASLRHILELEPDFIKVDRSLIDGFSDDPARRAAVAAFASLAHAIGARVVAEGIEQRADLETARELRLDAAQGYLLARPTADRRALTRWLNAKRRVRSLRGDDDRRLARGAAPPAPRRQARGLRRAS